MRTTFGLKRPVSCLFLVAVACSDLTTTGHDLSVTTQVTPGSFRAGTTVTVQVTVTNIGGKAGSIETNTCGHLFAVLDASGKTVAPPGEACTAVSIPRVLNPGESTDLIQQWTGAAGISATLAPGSYSIRPTVTQIGVGVLGSATVPIQILP